MAAWCLRFVLNIRKKQNRVQQLILLLQEVELADTRLIRLSPQGHYCKEIDILKKNRQLPLKSCLTVKHPFIDGQGILHVGRIDKFTARPHGQASSYYSWPSIQLLFMAKHPAIIHGQASSYYSWPSIQLLYMAKHPAIIHGQASSYYSWRSIQLLFMTKHPAIIHGQASSYYSWPSIQLLFMARILSLNS